MKFSLRKYKFLHYILSRSFELKNTPKQPGLSLRLMQLREESELGSAVEQEVGYSASPSNFKYFVDLKGGNIAFCLYFWFIILPQKWQFQFLFNLMQPLLIWCIILLRRLKILASCSSKLVSNQKFWGFDLNLICDENWC